MDLLVYSHIKITIAISNYWVIAIPYALNLKFISKIMALIYQSYENNPSIAELVTEG